MMMMFSLKARRKIQACYYLDGGSIRYTRHVVTMEMGDVNNNGESVADVRQGRSKVNSAHQAGRSPAGQRNPPTICCVFRDVMEEAEWDFHGVEAGYAYAYRKPSSPCCNR